MYRQGDSQSLVARRFGRLLIVRVGETHVAPCGKKQSTWECQCDCGKTVVVMRASLRRGATQSCGCLRRELVAKKNTRHGMSKSGTYSTWCGMIDRCGNPRHEAYKNYGGRGIAVCERWLMFENFLADMGERPPGRSIDRYPNNDGNYEPGNCRWATRKEQRANQRPVKPQEKP